MTWQASDITVELVDDMSEGDLFTVVIGTAAGRLTVLARVVIEGHTVRLSELHIQSPDVGAGGFGWTNLRRVGRAVLAWFGNYDELIIEGAVRTSGANPGRTPSLIRFTRDLRSQEASS